MAANGDAVKKSVKTSIIGDSSPRTSFIHTPFYCEENVYLLCKQLCKLGIADQKGIDLFVVFISNEEKKIPLWCQKASKRSDGLVIWDYHVICIQLQKNDEVNDHHMVWDLDSSLPYPIPLKHYIAETILTPFPINPIYGRIFRVVHAPIFLRCFASDRSHMKDSLGNWISLPPGYKPIVAEDGTENNLSLYIQMSAADITSDIEALIHGVLSNRYGVLISESTLESFFSQISSQVALLSCSFPSIQQEGKKK